MDKLWTQTKMTLFFKAELLALCVSWHVGGWEGREIASKVLYTLKCIAVHNYNSHKQCVSCNSFLLIMFAASNCGVNIESYHGILIVRIMKYCMLSAREVDNGSYFKIHPNVHNFENSMPTHKIFRYDCQNSLLTFLTIISHWLLAG